MSAPFEFEEPDKRRGIALYFEDECIALNTWDNPRGRSTHEIMLDAEAVENLIQALTTMQANIRARYQKAITS